MRRAILLTLIFLSLGILDRRRIKNRLRRLAIAFSRLVLRQISPPYVLRPQTAVVFAPHQDDETFGCGGLIARKRNEGFPVHVVFITDGSASHPGHSQFSPAAIAALRRREARAALAILGVESGAIHFLDAPDGTLHQLNSTQRSDLIARIAELLRQLKPDEVFLPCCPDGSSEHDAAFSFIIEALHHSHLRPAVWQYPVWSWWNPLLLFRRIFSSHGRCQAPTEDYQLIKHRAVACYRSQTEPLPPQSQASLPRELVKMFNSDVEYFFRFNLSTGTPDLDPARPLLK
ncbi:MAG TPA: PIG-L family deacetylase [Opitutaceae bacterium]|nr:PIG-L family deacetylase [Opitutaceae bacterium]